MHLKLEERHCICGKSFKCLPTSLQQYHAKTCENLPEPVKGWKARLKRFQVNPSAGIKTPITTGIIKDINAKPIPLGLKEQEPFNAAMLKSTENDTEKSLEKEAEPMNLNTEKNEEKKAESLDDLEITSYLNRNEDYNFERSEEEIQTSLDRPSRIGTINGIRQHRSLPLPEISKKEFSHSKNLIDESISQLQELTKLSVATLHSQEAKLRDPQMVNAAINSAKAINELLKTKLNAARMFK